MCGSFLCPLCTIYRVTSYLRLLALSMLNCSPNMSFLARPVYGQFQKFRKIELVALSPATPKEKYFCTGSEILFIATCASDLTFLPPLTTEDAKQGCVDILSAFDYSTVSVSVRACPSWVGHIQ